MSTAVISVPKDHIKRVAENFGAPPANLQEQRGPIADFFNAAAFQPVLSPKFLEKYAGQQPIWGPVGYIVYKRTYARPLYPGDLGLETHHDYGEWVDAEGIPHNDVMQVRDPDVSIRSEEAWESLTRIVNGLWHILRCHSHRKNIEFSEKTARRKAEAQFVRLWNFKWLPPGRGLWMMGTFQMYAKGSAALNNCGFVSTANIAKEASDPFAWAMDMSMLGVGIGFDARGADTAQVVLPSNLRENEFEAILSKRVRVYQLAMVSLPKRQYIPQLEGLPAQTVESLDSWRERIRTELAWAVPQDSEHAQYEMVLDEEFLVDKLYLRKTFTELVAQRHPYTWSVEGWKVDPTHADVPDVTSDFHPVQQIPDTREGWVTSVAMIIDAFLTGSQLPVFDYKLIRPKNTPIRGFGGVAEGPEFLEICHQNLVQFFLDRIGKKLTAADIVDLFNEIGACVVSGNVRRSAQIALGDPFDEDFIALKHDGVNHPNCWNSNNSILAQVGMDYSRIGELIATHGEPGVLWIENARRFGRMGEKLERFQERERNVMGVNPCAEQTLHNYELCCLVENFPAAHDDADDFMLTLKQSYLYAKAVTLVPCHSKRTNEVMGKNSRIGSSMSGIQQARRKFGTRSFLTDFADAGFKFLKELDERYSEWLQVRLSIKRTSVKPSGTVSKLPGIRNKATGRIGGTTAGIHDFIEGRYLQHIRFSKTNYMVKILADAGYRVFDAPEQPESTCIIAFPVEEQFVFRTEREAAESIAEQLEFVAQFQALWADNSVSVTVKFHQHSAACRATTKTTREFNEVLQATGQDPVPLDSCNCLKERGAEIAQLLSLYETRLKAASFLPYHEVGEGAYADAAPPYVPISEEQYLEEIQGLQPYTLNEVSDDIYAEDCGAACPVR